VQEKLADLYRQQEATGREWNARILKMEAKEIGLVRDPLAVPALDRLLSGNKPLLRLAAVTSLGAIESEGAVAGLIRALADPDPSVTRAAASFLVGKKRSPFIASLHGPTGPVKPGESLGVEWRVTNLSPAELEITLEEPPARRLQLGGPRGPVALSLPQTGGRRALRLGPGEYVGGEFSRLTLKMVSPGRYQVAWTAVLTWNGRSVAIDAAPVTVDRR
jgi:hypothetical protein